MRRLDDAGVQSAFTPKSIVLLFVAVLGLYLLVFHGIERARVRQGPWEVEFQSGTNGSPAVTVAEPKLGLSRVKIIFHGETAGHVAGRVLFDRVKQPVPFGKVIYEDLTFLPGVVTFDLFGHEIELLPRVLIVNRKQVAWQSDQVIELWPTNKPAEPPRPPKARR